MLLLKEPLVGCRNAFFQCRAWLPPGFTQSTIIHKATWHTVRLVTVVDHFTGKSDYLANDLNNVADGVIRSGTCIDNEGARIVLQKEDNGIGAIVIEKEFAARRARSPDLNPPGPRPSWLYGYGE